MWDHTYLGLKVLHWPWHGDDRNCTHKCQNGNIVHTHLSIALCESALRFAHVVCESWEHVHKLHTKCCPLVHVSGVHRGAEHSAHWAKDIGNGRKWPKMDTLMVGASGAHVRLGPGCAL